MNVKKKEVVLMLIFFLCIVFGILVYTGTITSGMHLVDDHEHYTIAKKIDTYGLGKTIINDLKVDLTMRFRPLYRIARVVGTSVLGTNSIAWSIYKGLEIVVSMLLLYIFARKKGLPIIFATLFSLFCFVGEQSEIWWRLGPQEGTGMVLFGIGLLTALLVNEKSSVKNRLLFVFIMIMLSLQKETFLLTVPIFFLILFEKEFKECEYKLKDAILAFLRKYILEIIGVLIVCIIDVYMIMFVVGTDKLSYAGFSEGIQIKEYVKSIINSITGSCLFYVLLVTAILLLIVYLVFMKKIELRLDKSYLVDFLICIWILGIQIVCYARSGMYARYLVPWVFGIFYFIFIIGYKILGKTPIICRWLGIVMAMVLLIPIHTTIVAGKQFANAGNSLWQCIEHIDLNTDNNVKVISMFFDPEPDNAFKIYLEGMKNYQDVSVIMSCQDDKELLKTADVLFGYNSILEQQIVNDIGNNIDEYDIFATTNYKVAIKKQITNN